MARWEQAPTVEQAPQQSGDAPAWAKAPAVEEQTAQPPAQDSSRDASLGERFVVNMGEGFEGTLAGQMVQNARNPANAPQARANTLADVIGRMMETGADTAPATLPNPAQGGTPSPEGDDYLGVGVETEMPRIGTGDLAGQSQQALAAEYFRRMQQAEAGQEQYDEMRAPVLERRQNMPSWYEEEGAIGKGLAGATALAGQLVGGTPSPENLLAFGRGANVASRFIRGAAGGAAGAGVAEPVVQQQEVRRGEREETSVAEGAFNVALGGLLGGTLNVTPDAARAVRQFVANRRNKPVEEVAPEDLEGFDPAELVRMVEQTNEAQRLSPEDLGEIVTANTGQDARPQVGEGLDPRQRAGARRAEERSLGELFGEGQTDVLRREDVDVGEDGLTLREGAQPLRDPTGQQANPSTYGTRAFAERIARDNELTLSDDNLLNAAREIAENPDANALDVVRSYSDETRGQAFARADVQSRRGEEYARDRQGRVEAFENQPEQVQQRVRQEYIARGIDPDAVESQFNRAYSREEMRDVPDMRDEQAQRSREEFSRPAFDIAERRRQRREEDLADGERVDSQASTYRAAEEPFERAPQRSVTLLDAQRDRQGNLTGGEAVEVLARDRQLNAQGQVEEIARVRIGDDEPVWVPASRLSDVETPENPRMAAEARSQTREPPRGVMTERGDGPEGAPSQTPEPRRAGDRISDPQGLRRGQYQEGEAPQGAGPTSRADEPPVSEQGGQAVLPRRPETSDRRDVTPQGEARTEFQGEGGQMEVETTRRPVRETTRAQAEPEPAPEQQAPATTPTPRQAQDDAPAGRPLETQNRQRRDTDTAEQDARRIREDAVAQIDEALDGWRNGTPPEGENVVIDVPDGPTYTVRNNEERLQAFRRQVQSGSRPAQAQTRQQPTTGTRPSNRDQAVRGLLADEDLSQTEAGANAINYADNQGLWSGFTARDDVFIGEELPADRMNGVEGLVLGQFRVSTPDGPTTRWAVMAPESGVMVDGGGSGRGFTTKAKAVDASRKAIGRFGADRVRERIAAQADPDFQANKRAEFDRRLDGDDTAAAPEARTQAETDEPAAEPEARQQGRADETESPDADTPDRFTASDQEFVDNIDKARTGKALLDAIEEAVPAAFRPLLNALRASSTVSNVKVRNNNRMRGAEGRHVIKLSGKRDKQTRQATYTEVSDQYVEVNVSHVRGVLDGSAETRLSGQPRESVAQIMLHELSHAGTARAMDRNVPKSGGKVGPGKTVNRSAWSRLSPSEKIEGIRRGLEAKLNDTDLDDVTRANIRSAITDIQEVVAWGMTNPEVMAVLKDMPALSKKHSSRFGDFIDAVRQALGLTTKHRSALTDLVEQTGRLLDESDAGSTRILDNNMARRAEGGDSETVIDSISNAITAKELAARKAAQKKGALRSGDVEANKEGLETAFQRATGLGSTEAKRWVAQNERLARNLREARERQQQTGATNPRKFWQQGSLASQFSQYLFGSLDGEMRAMAARHDSAVMASLADVFHARAGRADSTKRTLSERESQHLNSRARDLQRIQNMMDDAKVNTRQDMTDIINMVEDSRKPRTGTKGEIANRIDQWFKEELEYQQKAGVEIGVVDDYFARHTDPGLISGGKGSKRKEDRFVAQATKAYQEMGLNEVDAKDSAQGLLNRILGNDLEAKPGAAELSGGAPTRNVNQRKFTAAAAKHLDEFRDKDVNRVMSRYLMGSTKRAEIAQSTVRLPDGTEIAFGDRFSNIGEVMQALEADGVPAADINHVRDMIATNTGVQGSRRIGWLMKASTTVRTMGALSFMDRSALSSVPELMTGALRTLTGDPMQDLSTIAGSLATDLDSSMRKLFSTISGRDMRSEKMTQARELAEDLGMIAGDSVSYLMSARFIGDDASGPLLQRIQTGFFRNTGLTALNDYTRVKAVRAGDTFIRRMAKDVMKQGNPRKNNSGAYFLRELGIAKGEERGFADWMVRNFDESMPSTAELMRMGGKDAEYAEMYRTGMQRIADQSVMRPDAATKPRWASHPVGAMAFHLQSFTWAFTQNVIKRWWRIGNDPDLATLDKLMLLPGFVATGGAMFGLSYAANEVRDQLTELSSEREPTPRTAGADLERAISYTGFVGKVDPLLQMFSGTRYQRSIAESLLGPSAGTLVGTADALLTATLSNSENTNTAERNLVAALHQTIVTPALQAGLAMGPGFGLPGLLVGGATITGVRATRDPVVNAVAGEEEASSVRRRMDNPTTSLVEQLMDEDGTSGGRAGGRAAGGRTGGRSAGGREGGR